MTAASAHLMRPSLRASSGGWPVRVLTLLALVLPIPLCAALGLSLPLPSTVARIAAKLVPFANSAVLDAREEQLLGARGSIVRLPGEPAGNLASALGPGGSPAVFAAQNAGRGGVPGGKVDGSPTVSPNGTAPVPADPNLPPTLLGGSTSAPNTGGTPPAPPQGGGAPVPPTPAPTPPSPTPTVVDTATAAAATVVGTVSATATTATSAVPATVAPVVGVVTGVVGPVLPPKP
jgi:hypothetical protein